MPGMGQQRRRQRRSVEGVQGNRRIYDPRRWHKRTSGTNNKSVSNSGQPPAGWMLVWAGRFKRWRRRWFVAHPPGLLLHYKTSEQIGRPGCISLLEATAGPTPGKERQIKIVRGSMVYYLRTLNKDYRQSWLDAIHESMRIYNKSVQKAAVGATPGRGLLPQQSVPEHVKQEWEAQERELNRRLAERLEDLEPASKAFLQQLQLLQQSLSVISGALGFSDKPETMVSSSSNTELNRMPDVWNGIEKVDGYSFRNSRNNSGDEGNQRLSSPEVGGSDASQSGQKFSDNGFSLPENSRTQRSIFKWKGDGESKQCKKRSSKSAPSASLISEKSLSRTKRRSFSFSMDESLRHPEYVFLREGSCIGGECFKWKKKNSQGDTVLKGHVSDSEVVCANGCPHPDTLKSPLLGEHKPKDSEIEESSVPASTELGESVAGPSDVDQYPGIKENGSSPKNGSEKMVVGGSARRYAKSSELGIHGSKYSNREISGRLTIDTNTTQTTEKVGPVVQGPLHAAWHSLQEAFAEALKVEIHRVLELEAENAVLQESLAMMPQLQKDRTDLLSLRESLQKDGSLSHHNKFKSARNGDAEDVDDDEYAHDTDDDISLVHTELTNEEYFEALEVLNQHDFIAKSTTTEDQDGLSDREDGGQEPPEEGDIPVDAELMSEADIDELDQPRTRLPSPRPLSRGFSLWTVLKNAIGKDLNHITMPATINEPLSVLQKCAEEMQYRYLLERAAQEQNSVKRLLWVSTFACASYHGSIHRDAKPFNPLLGETYEWLAPDEKSWFLAEQVSHHPPIMAFHSEGSVGDYTIYGEIEIKNKFWGKSVEVQPTGVCHLRYGKHGDHFTWNKVTTCAHNVVVGRLWIDNYGELVIKNHATGDTSRIRFQKAGSKEQCRISGKVYDSKGVAQYTIHGNYMDKIYATPESSKSEDGRNDKCMWKSPEAIEDYRQQYCFTKFSIGLNELTPKLADTLPPTDSRLRPDQRALEDGDLEKATPEKLRLEEKQREARKLRKDRGQDWQVQWFKQREPGISQVKTTDDGEEPSWVYDGKYWEARDKQAWQACPDIM
ncbi:hypothetical protein MPTK1_8g15240 [Marchantia polymorpha subsp. ruderalis]|uniref:PH domain-containing protein n=1 Tax=Marchantia polymorpha TaxID=3197 RepID=A0A2R6W1H1_MARPO|nr:hypothetical protein MARPO_0187s0011 [Marchantia polymorpha]BBN19959.1 hypothetical protein Mp_8g15240 [Marchantia polymorpha subsp. ruderalis]|eukprot:PTQ27688.1 hypothetical protein MARPO_0187s0011 [Marchantia polymorpha]